MSSSEKFDDSSPTVTAEGQNSTLHDVTVSFTPVPMAASTAGRQLAATGRYVIDRSGFT